MGQYTCQYRGQYIGDYMGQYTTGQSLGPNLGQYTGHYMGHSQIPDIPKELLKLPHPTPQIDNMYKKENIPSSRSHFKKIFTSRGTGE